MACKKCGYIDKKETTLFGSGLCKVCATFAPRDIRDFQEYISEKVDWKDLDTFRRHENHPDKRKKEGMETGAISGKPQARPPLGYDIKEGDLVPNEDASRIHSLFRTFLVRNYTLSSLSKNFSLSINGLKKVLTNRTYLGEIKFNGRIHKGQHRPLINPEIFYAVQRKLQTYLRPRRPQDI
jgi:hypothetical protein